MAHWHRLGVAVGIAALVGCGNQTPDAPVSGTSTGSAGAVASSPEGDAASAGPVAHEPARQAPTQTAPLGPPVQQASTLEGRITDVSRATSPMSDARVQTAATPAATQQSDERVDTDQAQRETRQLWFEEVRENPDVTVRLQALELWAEQPGDGIDPLTYALVDEDEQVRARAEELWEQQLTKEERFEGQAEW